MFQRNKGLTGEGKAKLVRFADDMVILAKQLSPEQNEFIEGKLEEWMGLEINRYKTREVQMGGAKQSFDFLGFTFRYDKDLKGRPWRCLNICNHRKQ